MLLGWEEGKICYHSGLSAFLPLLFRFVVSSTVAEGFAVTIFTGSASFSAICALRRAQPFMLFQNQTARNLSRSIIDLLDILQVGALSSCLEINFTNGFSVFD